MRNPRPWYVDALTAIVFFSQAILLGRWIGRAFPFAGLFLFLSLAGLGWFFARAAWTDFMRARNGDKRP